MLIYLIPNYLGITPGGSQEGPFVVLGIEPWWAAWCKVSSIRTILSFQTEIYLLCPNCLQRERRQVAIFDSAILDRKCPLTPPYKREPGDRFFSTALHWETYADWVIFLTNDTFIGNSKIERRKENIFYYITHRSMLIFLKCVLNMKLKSDMSQKHLLIIPSVS